MDAVVGGQRLIERLGEGGMGVVFRARDEVLGRETAVKMLHPELSQQGEIVQRFFNEARAAAVLRHIGIVQIYSFGHHTDGSAYLVMELLDGESLEARLAARGTLPPTEAVRLASQVCSALAAAHRAHIVHRDLKPDNIYLIPDSDVPGGERIKILDFGIAKLAPDARPGLVTRAGMVLGTPDYMAPEQCSGAGDVDGRADLYALGCILFRALCGRAPFLGEQFRVIAAQLRDPPPRPRDLAPGIPPALEAIVLKLLAKRREDRFQSAEELRAALEACPLDASASEPPAAVRELDAPPLSAAPPAWTGTRAAPATPAAAAGEVLAPITPPPRPERAGMLVTAAALVAAGAIAGFVAVERSAAVEVLAGVAAPVPVFEPPREPAVELCSGEACVERARRHELGGDLELDYHRAAELYLHACVSGSAEGCERIGHFHAQAIGVEYDRALARRYLRRACGEHGTGGCAELGILLVGEHAGAAAYFEQGCESGHAPACLAQARLVPMPADQKRRLRERAGAISRGRCQTGIAAACATMVEAFEDANPKEVRDDAAARACERDQPIGCAAHPSFAGHWRPLMMRACEAGHSPMCAELAERILEAPRTADDPQLASELLWRACERRMPRACTRLWRLDTFDKRVSVPPDRLIAGCERSPKSCVIASVYLSVHHEPERAVELAVRGCEGGAGEACALAAQMFESGRPPVQRDLRRRDAMRARWLEIQSAECRDDVVIGCAGLGRYYRAVGQLDAAADMLEKACVANDRAACAEVREVERAREASAPLPSAPGLRAQ